MKSFKYLPFAALALMSATSLPTMANDNVVVKEFKIDVDADMEKGANIMVDHNGNHSMVKLPIEALSDPAQIDAAVADLPDDVREKVKQALTNINMSGDVFAIHLSEDTDKQWLSKSGDEQVIIVDVDTDESTDGEIVKKVIKKFVHGKHDGEQVFEFKHGKISADTIIHLLNKGEYTADELNKIQQALDAKR